MYYRRESLGRRRQTTSSEDRGADVNRVCLIEVFLGSRTLDQVEREDVRVG